MTDDEELEKAAEEAVKEGHSKLEDDGLPLYETDLFKAGALWEREKRKEKLREGWDAAREGADCYLTHVIPSFNYETFDDWTKSRRRND